MIFVKPSGVLSDDRGNIIALYPGNDSVTCCLEAKVLEEVDKQAEDSNAEEDVHIFICFILECL